MLNNLILVGRVATKPEVRNFDDGNRVADFVLAVDKPFKSQDGKTDCDFFKVSVWQAYADVVYTYCGVGSVVGVKGRLTTHKTDLGDKKITSIDIIGERIAFIHTVHPNEKEEDLDFTDLNEADVNEKVEKVSAKKSKQGPVA